MFAYLSAFYCNDGAGNVDCHQRPDLHDLHAAAASMPTGRQWSQLTPTTRSATRRSSSPTSAAQWTVSNVKLGTSVAGALGK